MQSLGSKVELITARHKVVRTAFYRFARTTFFYDCGAFDNATRNSVRKFVAKYL